MTVIVNNVANTDTFEKLLETVNFIANTLSTSVISTGSNTVGDFGVSGNVSVGNISTGNIICNYIVSNTDIIIGNSTVLTSVNSSSIAFNSPTTSFTIGTPNTSQQTSGQYYLNANGSFSTIQGVTYPIANATIHTANTGANQLIDYWQISNYNTAQYTISVKDNISNNFYSSSILVMHNSVNAQSTEFAQLISNTSVGVFTSSSNATHVLLYFSPVSVATTVKFVRVIM